MTGFDGFYSVIKNIPDEVIHDIQVFLADLAPIYNKAGFDAFFVELLGIEPQFAKEFMDLLDEKQYLELIINIRKLKKMHQVFIKNFLTFLSHYPQVKD